MPMDLLDRMLGYDRRIARRQPLDRATSGPACPSTGFPDL